MSKKLFFYRLFFYSLKISLVLDHQREGPQDIVYAWYSIKLSIKSGKMFGHIGDEISKNSEKKYTALKGV